MSLPSDSSTKKPRSKSLLVASVQKLIEELSPTKSRRKTFGKSENLPIMNVARSRSLSQVYKTQPHQEVIKAERRRFCKIGAFSPSEIISSLERDEKLSKSYTEYDCVVFEKSSNQTKKTF